ncbi:MAG: sulfatase-like hydrolase/transferase [Fuerstiella sp.]
MNGTEDSGSPDPGPETNPTQPDFRFLHLFGLTALAVAQPMLDRLGRNSTYLELKMINGPAVWMAVVLVLIGMPLLQWGLIRSAALLNTKCASVIYSALVGVLSTLLVWLWLNWASIQLSLKSHGVPDVAVALVAALTGLVMVVQYRKRSSVRWFVSVVSWCALSVPVVFATSREMKPILFPSSGSERQSERIGNPVPVVMIVFDGLNGMALLNEHRELDAERYPGFARLASMSTWYRNASTVHYRTDNAVPAILTGQRPSGGLRPVEANYPDNLFRRIFDSQQYEMTVFEPYTRLAPRQIRSDRLTLVQQVTTLLDAVGRVYVDVTMPDEIPGFEDIIPRPWFGIAEGTDVDNSVLTGVIMYGWDTHRREQVDYFQRCLVRSERPWFRYLHLVLPHYPWNFLPSGRTYCNDLTAADYPIGSHGVLGEDWGPDQLACDQGWQRYLLQLGYVDACLNSFLDRLQSAQMLDESLVIVVADHGAAFRQGVGRRVPASETVPDIMSVPLLIKLPGQQTGRISDRNVETVDVLPTIADVLQMQTELDTDGVSLLDESTAERPRKEMAGPDGPIIVESDFPQRFDYVRRVTRLFGSGSRDRLMSALNFRPDIVGRSVSDLPTTDDGPAVELHYGIDIEDATTDEHVPCYLQGRIHAPELGLPVTLAVAVNGRITATTRTFSDPACQHDFAAMSPETAFSNGDNDIEVFEVRQNDSTIVLKRCRLSGSP